MVGGITSLNYKPSTFSIPETLCLSQMAGEVNIEKQYNIFHKIAISTKLHWTINLIWKSDDKIMLLCPNKTNKFFKTFNF